MFRFINKLVLVFSLMVMTIFANAQYYDATESFSLTDNPHAGWSGGWTASLGNTFHLYTTIYSNAGGSAWIDPSQGTAPYYGKVIVDTNGALAGQSVMHPGSGGQHSVLRFTVPETGEYTLSSQFYAGDRGNENITVLLNENSVQSLFSTSTNSNPIYDTTLFLIANDTVDFAIWGEYTGGTTPLRVRFTKVPDSGTTVSVGGIIALQGTQNAVQPITFTFHPTTGSAFTRYATLNFAGSYTVDNIPSGQYIVSIKGAKWLRKNISVDVRLANITNANATLLAGDANNDNFADIADLLLLIAHYNQASPNAGYSDAADFNCDGVDDIADLLLLIGNYNKQGDS